MTEPMPGVPQAAPPVCPRHTDRVSYVRCQRCERPTCPDCQVPAPVGVLCVDCAREAERSGRAARNSLGLKRGPSTPVLTYALIAANVLFYAYGQATGLTKWQFDFGLIPMLADSEPYRLVTSGFVHGGVLHLALNMFMLFQIGTQLEQVLGRLRYALLYTASLLGGSAAVMLLDAPNSWHVGASGAIFGLFAAYGLLLFRLKMQWQSIAAQAGIWIVIGFLMPRISWQGHIGGAVVGLVTAWIIFALAGRKKA